MSPNSATKGSQFLRRDCNDVGSRRNGRRDLLKNCWSVATARGREGQPIPGSLDVEDAAEILHSKQFPDPGHIRASYAAA